MSLPQKVWKLTIQPFDRAVDYSRLEKAINDVSMNSTKLPRGAGWLFRTTMAKQPIHESVAPHIPAGVKFELSTLSDEDALAYGI